MSLTVDDLIWIPSEPEVFMAAAAYTCRCLQHACNRQPRPAPRELKKRSSTAAAELMTRRWLARAGVPYHLAALAPVTEPDHCDLVLGGRQASIVARFLHTPGRPNRWDWLLSSTVPLVSHERGGAPLRKGDLVIFTFLIPARPSPEGSPTSYLAAWPPAPGISRLRQRRFLRVRSRSSHEVELELAGLGSGRKPTIGHLALAPYALASIAPAFQNLLYLHPVVRPAGKLELFEETSERIWAVAPQAWVDLILPLSGAILVGWTTVRGSEDEAHVDGGSASGKVRSRDPSILVRDLRPMQELARRLHPSP